MSKRLLLVAVLIIMVIATITISAFNRPERDGVVVNQQIAGSIFNWIEVTDSVTFTTKNAGLLSLTAKGSPGSANLEVVGSAVPVATPSGLCPETTDLELTFIDGGIVETFSDQSLLFYVIDNSPEAANALYVDFTGPNTGIFDYVVTGGAGRFEGATGGSRVEIISWDVTSVLSGETGEINGVIHLP
jgi:hypothetical protein